MAPSQNLVIENLAAGYGSQCVLEIRRLEIEPASVTGLVGSNGSGKSTLLKAISGHVGYSGTISWDGHALRAGSPWNRLTSGIGILFQENFAFGELSVEDNLRFLADRMGVRWNWLREEYRMWLPGDGRWKRQAGLLSEGQKKRIAIAMVLAAKPRLLLLDEPSANLDPESRVHLAQQIRERARQGATVITAEQDLEFLCGILGASDRVFGMTEGTICHVRTYNERNLMEACASGRCGF